MPLIVIFASTLTQWITVPLLMIVLALHSSLQHEILHGHPFANRLLNEALVFIPAGLFLPYRRFRDTHIQHHTDPNLTNPVSDPESNYVDPVVWSGLSKPKQVLLTINNTLSGRMILGPAIDLYAFYKKDLKAMLRGEAAITQAYVLHIVGMLPMIWWFTLYATMPVWAYVLASYGALSLLKVRTFLEHRAHENWMSRTVIIESRGFFSFLFLNNNFHLVHHNHPNVAWYKLPAVYANNRDHYLRLNADYRYKNYTEIFQRYLLHTKDSVPHPLWSSEPSPQPGIIKNV